MNGLPRVNSDKKFRLRVILDGDVYASTSLFSTHAQFSRVHENIQIQVFHKWTGLHNRFPSQL